MRNTGLAKLANYENNERPRPEAATPVAKALELVVRALNLQNGSLKVYVHQGKPSPRIEIQTSICKEIEG